MEVIQLQLDDVIMISFNEDVPMTEVNAFMRNISENIPGHYVVVGKCSAVSNVQILRMENLNEK